MGGVLASIPRLAVAAAIAFGATPGAAVPPAVAGAQEVPAASGAALEEKLREALATNAALKERIKKLEEMLQRDVCAEPAAAEALLNAKVPTPEP